MQLYQKKNDGTKFLMPNEQQTVASRWRDMADTEASRSGEPMSIRVEGPVAAAV